MSGDSKQAYEDKLQAQLDLWKAEMAKLRAQADVASAEARIKINQHMEKLMDEQKQAHEKLEELQQASSDAWHDMKSGVDKSFEIFSASVKSAMSRFL